MSKPHSPADFKPLNIKTRRKILDAHCILTTYYGNSLFAFDGEKLVNTEKWSKKDIYDWLGY